MSLLPSVFNCDRAAVDPTKFMQALCECRDTLAGKRWVPCAYESNARHLFRVLRADGRRQPTGSTAKKCNELAPLHSITSSAVASSVGGTVRLSVFAVLRLITRSNLVD